MMMTSKKIKATRLDYESKVLLLTILAQGYITAEQKQAFSSLLDVKTTYIGYVSNTEGLKEMQEIFKEIGEDFERRSFDGFTELPNLDRETINEALNRN
jgi:hypothetical protein